MASSSPSPSSSSSSSSSSPSSSSYLLGQWTIPSSQVFLRTPHVYGVVNLSPVVPHHVLLVPVSNARRLADVDDDESDALLRAARRVTAVLSRECGAPSFTLALQDGKEAGQTVSCVHLHVIPRHGGDFAANDDVYREIEKPERVRRSEQQMADEARWWRPFFAADSLDCDANGTATTTASPPTTTPLTRAPKLSLRAPIALRTPLVHSRAYSRALSRALASRDNADDVDAYDWHVLLKLESLQPSGSFKLRGVAALVEHEIARRAAHTPRPLRALARVVSSSGGNAGLAAAHTATRLGLPCIVFVPESTLSHVVDQLRTLGADVRVTGKVWDETNRSALAFIADSDASERATIVGGGGSGSGNDDANANANANANADANADADADDFVSSSLYVHPFDHEVMWRGHARWVDECYEQVVDALPTNWSTTQRSASAAASAALPTPPDAVVLSVGGGGLYCGTIAGLRRQVVESRWCDVPIVACETHGAASLHAAAQRNTGEPVAIDGVRSVATSLGAMSVARQAARHASRSVVDEYHPTTHHLLDDAAAVAGCRALLTDHLQLVEPACGAALDVVVRAQSPESPLLKLVPAGQRHGYVVVVVCGGRVVTEAQLTAWEAQLNKQPGAETK